MAWLLDDPAVIDDMFLATGGVEVSYGGVTGRGHFAHVPVAFGQDGGVVASEPSVVIASAYFPDIYLSDETGVARGTGRRITVGDYVWTVRAIEPGEAPGEIRLMLSNRTNG